MDVSKSELLTIYKHAGGGIPISCSSSADTCTRGAATRRKNKQDNRRVRRSVLPWRSPTAGRSGSFSSSFSRICRSSTKQHFPSTSKMWSNTEQTWAVGALASPIAQAADIYGSLTRLKLLLPTKGLKLRFIRTSVHLWAGFPPNAIWPQLHQDSDAHVEANNLK